LKQLPKPIYVKITKIVLLRKVVHLKVQNRFCSFTIDVRLFLEVNWGDL